MKQRVALIAPVLSVSGYGIHSRVILKSLLKYEDYYDIFIQPLNWGQTSWLSSDTEFKRVIDQLLEKTQKERMMNGGRVQADMTIQCTIPIEFQKISQMDIGITALCETSKIPVEWVEKINIMDKVIVPSTFNVNVAKSSKYEVQNRLTGEIIKNFGTNKELTNIGFPYVDIEPDKDILNTKFKYDFNYLVIAQFGPRKNLHNTIKNFIETFHDDEVGMIIKGNIANNSAIDREYCQSSIWEIVNEYKDKKCSVELIHGYMKTEELYGLYNHPQIKGLVSISHGESWGLPMFEAASCGLPIITTDWGGQTDYLYMRNKRGKNVPMFTKVKYDLKPIQKEAVWRGVLEPESMWAFPDVGNYMMKLKEFKRNYGELKKRAIKLQNHIKEEYSEEKIYEKYHKTFSEDAEEMFDWIKNINSLEEDV